MTKLFLTKDKALQKHPITDAELYSLLAKKLVDTITIDYGNGPELAFYDDHLAGFVARRDIHRKDYDYLRGNRLGMSEAAVKYRLRISTISKWTRSGELEIRGEDGLKKLVDEADVAYLADFVNAQGIRPGKKLLNKNLAGD